ncbi:hypothetical protein Tco_0943372 [Tanacetum coccineum]
MSLVRSSNVETRSMVLVRMSLFDGLLFLLVIYIIDSLTQDFVMSDSEDSTVTYTKVFSPFEDLSDIGSPGVMAPPLLDFVPELVYPEFMPPEDDVLLAEEQPLPAAVSPTADSPGYIIESDPEEDPKEDDEDLEEDPADYPTDRDDEEEDSFGDDADDEEEDHY